MTSTAPLSVTPAPKSRRKFDRDEVLLTAMGLFWRYGYEATSMATLLKATGLTAPSLYGAFGSKESLFEEAVKRYASIYGARLLESLHQPLPAREAVARMLHTLAGMLSSPQNPGGCLVTCGAMNCSEESKPAAALLRRLRQANEAALTQRLAEAAKSGELPKGTRTARLAKFYQAVMGGMQLQSIDGATRAELEAVAKDAMAAWPSV